MSSIEILETNVVAIRVDLSELKSDFRAAVARIDNDIKAAVLKLETEIRSVASKAAEELRTFSDRIEGQIAEMRAEDKYLREKIDRNHALLSNKIDTLTDKFSDLDRKVTDIGSKLTALLWVVGGLGTLITLAMTVGKALSWF